MYVSSETLVCMVAKWVPNYGHHGYIINLCIKMSNNPLCYIRGNCFTDRKNRIKMSNNPLCYIRGNCFTDRKNRCVLVGEN